MANARKKNPLRQAIALKDYGFDAEVYLTPYERQFAQNIVLEGNILHSYIQCIKPHHPTHKTLQDKDPKLRFSAYKLNSHSDVALYKEYYKKSIANDLIINTDTILKQLAVTLHTNANDFLDADGKPKDLKDISEIARSTLKMKWKYNAEGKAVGGVTVENISVTDLISSLCKLTNVDNDLVKALTAKMAKPEIVITKQEDSDKPKLDKPS